MGGGLGGTEERFVPLLRSIADECLQARHVRCLPGIESHIFVADLLVAVCHSGQTDAHLSAACVAISTGSPATPTETGQLTRGSVASSRPTAAVSTDLG